MPELWLKKRPRCPRKHKMQSRKSFSPRRHAGGRTAGTFDVAVLTHLAGDRPLGIAQPSRNITRARLFVPSDTTYLYNKGQAVAARAQFNLCLRRSRRRMDNSGGDGRLSSHTRGNGQSRALYQQAIEPLAGTAGRLRGPGIAGRNCGCRTKPPNGTNRPSARMTGRAKS